MRESVSTRMFNEAVRKLSQGALDDVSLYSIMEKTNDILRMLRVYLWYRAVLQRCLHRKP